MGQREGALLASAAGGLLMSADGRRKQTTARERSPGISASMGTRAETKAMAQEPKGIHLRVKAVVGYHQEADGHAAQ